MVRRIICAIVASALAVQPVHAQRRAAERGIVRVVIETERGPVDVALDSARAPRTVTNFLKYVDAAAYTNGAFHRTVTLANQPANSVRIQVIQGAANSERGALFPAIDLERTSATGLHHRDGTISMARAGPNTATSDFFICVGDQPELDFGGHRNADDQGFAAFGQVTRGMDVVRAIQTSPANGQTLTPPIRILGIHRQAAR